MPASAQFARLELQDGGIFVAQLPGHVCKQTIEMMLEEVWGHPNWKQPWGLVVVVPEGATYELDVRKTGVPGDDRRAAATAVVTSSIMQRAVVQTMGMGLRLASNFYLTGHAELEEGIDAVRERIASFTMRN